MDACVDIAVEPRGGVYRALLEYGRQLRSTVSLVWRDQHAFEPPAQLIATRLRADLIREARVDEWPGTRLIGSLAMLRIYRLSANTVTVLAEVGGLYEWLAPTRPEDLAFYANDGRAWLGSISHERDAFVEPEVIAIRELASQVPGLRLRHRDG